MGLWKDDLATRKKRKSWPLDFGENYYRYCLGLLDQCWIGKGFLLNEEHLWKFWPSSSVGSKRIKELTDSKSFSSKATGVYTRSPSVRKRFCQKCSSGCTLKQAEAAWKEETVFFWCLSNTLLVFFTNSAAVRKDCQISFLGQVSLEFIMQPKILENNEFHTQKNKLTSMSI